MAVSGPKSLFELELSAAKRSSLGVFTFPIANIQPAPKTDRLRFILVQLVADGVSPVGVDALFLTLQKTSPIKSFGIGLSIARLSVC